MRQTIECLTGLRWSRLNTTRKFSSLVGVHIHRCCVAGTVIDLHKLRTGYIGPFSISKLFQECLQTLLNGTHMQERRRALNWVPSGPGLMVVSGKVLRVLVHRLGLIPIKTDPRCFEYKPEGKTQPKVADTLVFKLQVKCTKKAHPSKDATILEGLFDNFQVFSNQIVWVPVNEAQSDTVWYLDSQAKYFSDNVGSAPVFDDDILIAKLRPGQEIDITMHCVKGFGRDHAKFSPVATVSYHMLPDIMLLADIEGDDALKIKESLADGVMGVRGPVSADECRSSPVTPADTVPSLCSIPAKGEDQL